MRKLQPPEKGHSLFPTKLPLKVEVLSSPPSHPFENLVGRSTPSPQQKGGGGGCPLAWYLSW